MEPGDPVNEDINAANAVKPNTPRSTDRQVRTCRRSTETENPVERAETAKQIAQRRASLDEHHTVGTLQHKYKVVKLIHEGSFGFTYKVRQDGSTKFYAMKTEPMTEEERFKNFKTLKTELILLQLFKQKDKAKTAHFVQLIDSGCTDAFKFTVTTLLGENLYTITRSYLNRAFTQSTALRVSIQMLRALMDLHSLGYVHRFLKPHTFAVGLQSTVRVVHMCDFSLCWQFKDEKGIKPPRRKVKMMGALRYTSRNSHHSRELSRRDDLESWLYLSMEFFHLNVLPWRGDQIPASVLFKKEKLFNDECPKAFKRTSNEYRSIMRYIKNMKFDETPDYTFLMQSLQDAKDALRCDFNVPYDWEALDLEKSLKTAKLPSPMLAVSMHNDKKKVDPVFYERTMKTQQKTNEQPPAVDNFNAVTDLEGKDVLIDVQMEGTCKNAKEKRTKSERALSDNDSDVVSCSEAENGIGMLIIRATGVLSFLRRRDGHLLMTWPNVAWMSDDFSTPVSRARSAPVGRVARKMISWTMTTKLLAVLLCLLSLTVFVKAADDNVMKISINEHFIFKWTLSQRCDNRYNDTTVYSCYDRSNPDDGKLKHHTTHRFDMRLVRMASANDLTIQHISPTFEYVRHKARFPRPGCEVDYEFINDKPFCDSDGKNSETSVCAKIDVVLFEIKKEWQARFHYHMLEIFTPMKNEYAGRFAFENETDGQCLCHNFVTYACMPTPDELKKQQRVVLAFNEKGRLGKVDIAAMKDLKIGDKLKVDDNWCKKETKDFKAECQMPESKPQPDPNM